MRAKGINGYTCFLSLGIASRRRNFASSIVLRAERFIPTIRRTFGMEQAAKRLVSPSGHAAMAIMHWQSMKWKHIAGNALNSIRNLNSHCLICNALSEGISVTISLNREIELGRTIRLRASSDEPSPSLWLNYWSRITNGGQQKPCLLPIRPWFDTKNEANFDLSQELSSIIGGARLSINAIHQLKTSGIDAN